MSDSDGSGGPGTTRRGALGRLLLLAGGAVGIGVAGKAAVDARDTAPSRTDTTRTRTQKLVLHGADWRLHSPGRIPGQLPQPDDKPVPRGRILDAAKREVGSFRAAALPGAAGAFQLHTFDLADGTILGIGGSQLDGGTFAIVGGTGRFTGASGSYTARQSPRDVGGDGTARFDIDLKAWEA